MNIQLIYVSLDVNPFTNKPESLHSYGAFKKKAAACSGHYNNCNENYIHVCSRRKCIVRPGSLSLLTETKTHPYKPSTSQNPGILKSSHPYTRVCVVRFVGGEAKDRE
jgi:hypothetical protein